MKYSHSLLYPSEWSMATKLSIAMLLIALVPMSLTVYSTLTRPDKVSIIVIGAIATVISLLLTKWLLRPIRLLSRAARALERGNFAPPMLAEISRTPDDIGYLAGVFAQMAARVKAAQEQQINQQVTEVLLRELNNTDLDWLTTAGQYQEIAAGSVLIQEGRRIDRFHVVLDGTLSVTVSKFEGSYLNRVYAQDQAMAEWEIAQLGSGEVVGETLLVDAHAHALATVKAIGPSLVLSIAQSQLTLKLKQDAGFAARFYRAIAVILSNRLHTFIRQMGCNPLTQDQPLRDVLSVLGSLNDSDIDWLVDMGQRQKILANSTLIHQGRPVDALYILLDGTLSVSTFDNVCNPFVRAFSILDKGKSPGQEVTRLSKGEIVGETPFLNAHLPPATIIALQDSLVLAIPRSQLAIKLQQDVGFAARFYRVLATLLSNRLQGLLSQLGYVGQTNHHHPSSNGSVASEDELNFSILDQMSFAGTRFDWMLKRLGGAEPV
ncbi:cyclic nucleotide-binding domain-containing protein (plasmid) [Kovacikia minuta CCNUW1]|uniref:cyclic nucleotide-binding domain-containing protein n=1 Tax=Kovacikia minuta TaxID=2931930 RepID=UPI001CD0337C|nr:cyclic nucleotide-binding domain-containing protein [Kovacikia minuta]UBF30470.1 cyclic nucleotide-binding domain-containing protein [Kovacikia minuta CCNUW1]